MAVADRYDIVIAGGGMVGASLACALSVALDDTLRVLVVESFDLPANPGAPVYQPSFDARSTALAVGSQRILAKLGAWDTLAGHVQPIRQIHVSNRGRPGSTVLSADQQGLPALGYVVENHWLGKTLLGQLRQAPRVDWLSPATVAAVHPDAEGATVVIRGHSGPVTTHCRLAVIADGAESALARSLGIRYDTRDYGHSAIIANVVTARPHAGMAFERFTARGPMALLPLSAVDREQRSALVWTMPADAAEALLQQEESSFLAELQRWFGYRLGRFVRAGERAAYPLQLVLAREQVRPGVVVVGNAAHFLHPVAGQGFNLALRDVDHLVGAIKSAQEQGKAPGDVTVLASWLRRQEWDQLKTTAFSDRVGALFMVRNALLGVPRDLALGVLDLLPPAKEWFVEEATGLGGRQARW